MSNRYFSYHNTACKLLASYHKEMPLQHFLRQYFSENKKHGSRDRKWISHFCYCFYRLGNALPNLEMAEKLPIAVYLCTDDVETLGDYLPEGWLRTRDLDAKIQYMQVACGFRLEDIFPFAALLVSDIDIAALNKSLLRQPDVFLRIRPGKQKAVLDILEKNAVAYQLVGENAVALKSRIAIDQLFKVNRDVVVQDFNSQSVTTFFPDGDICSLWDCCAASGGKTLLLRDHYPKAKTVVSDLRRSSLQNHKKRMQEAGVNVQKYFVQNLSQPFEMQDMFDLVVCDAPCSGSGTWARTPEEMYFFDKGSLSSTSMLQLSIARRIAQQVKVGGYLLYITCSLFKEEDDGVVEQLTASLPLSVVKRQLLLGTEHNADTLYGCLLRKMG
ncbi:MAG: hypothetical protein QM610_02390 [Chitinophagaceae bacterium]